MTDQQVAEARARVGPVFRPLSEGDPEPEWCQQWLDRSDWVSDAESVHVLASGQADLLWSKVSRLLDRYTAVRRLADRAQILKGKDA